MVAPGRRYGRLRGSGLSDATALARCGPCGARASNQMLRRTISTAKRTVTQGGNKRPLTRETRLENLAPSFRSFHTTRANAFPIFPPLSMSRAFLLISN